MKVLHVAPDPHGGWLVEAGDRCIPTSSYEDFAEAIRDAQDYAAAHVGWRVVVRDHASASDAAVIVE